jgi:hypothetical protein
MDAKNAALGDSKHATEFTLKVFAAAGTTTINQSINQSISIQTSHFLFILFFIYF